MNLFSQDFKINKPLRLIELFAGYGSQALAFKKIGAKFEHHFVCEFDKYAIKSYNAIHGTDFETKDIRDVHAQDLNITDTDKYCYLMTYSFPCTDLSLAGKQQGMKTGNSEGGCVYSDEGVSQTITAGTHGYSMGNIMSEYRIRKLTPKECFRLMGVEDEDSDKIISVNSNTQCYKQAGNSIVVDVMAAMFSKLF